MLSIEITCKGCHDKYLESLNTPGAASLPKPSYERLPEADFDEIKAFKCSDCGHIIEIEL